MAKCEVGSNVACNDECVRRVRGPKKGDPVFYCCIGCRAWLNRQGIRVRDVPAEKVRHG